MLVALETAGKVVTLGRSREGKQTGCLGDACAKAPGRDHAWCAEVVRSPVLDKREVVRSGR